jgi:hypothetical protein
MIRQQNAPMPRIAIAFSDVEILNGHAAKAVAFLTQFARLLRENGDDVSIILAHAGTEPIAADARWRESFRMWGIELIELDNRADPNRVPDVWLVRLSEQVAPILPAFDVVYFMDRANVAFHTTRVKRITTNVMPVCVTVLHGPSEWARCCDPTYARIPEDLNLDFVERYSALHSDFVAAPCQSILDWAKSNGWQFRGEAEVLGMPQLPDSLPPEQLAHDDHTAANRRWLAFHARVCDRKQALPYQVGAANESVRNAVDVCVTYHNQARHFPQSLDSLEHQTTQDFGVIAVDAGSPDEADRTVFNAAAERYAPRGWMFLRQPNPFSDRGGCEYLLMLDANDVAAPNAVERMLEAARLSGDDCLLSASCVFAGDEFPFDPYTSELTVPPLGYYMPLNANPAAALAGLLVLDGAMVLIRREVFEAIGGYREFYGATHGTRELLKRLALAGYKIDVLPEYLHFHRQIEAGSTHALDQFPHTGRILNPAQNKVSGLRRFAGDDEGSTLVRLVRRAYRKAVPLDMRLRLNLRLLKLIGRDPRKPRLE